jgi:hypothetical protein
MARRRTRRVRSTPAKQRAPVKVLLTAGAAAGAIGSILGLPPTVRALFPHHPAPIVNLKMRSAEPMTFGQSRDVVLGRRQSYSKADQALHGALITYKLSTQHYKKGTQLPMQWTVTDLETHQVRRLAAVTMTVEGERVCICHRWVPALNKGHRYQARLGVYAPGGLGSDNAPTEDTIRFTAT